MKALVYSGPCDVSAETELAGGRPGESVVIHGAGPERVMTLTGGQGADRGCECVGYPCCNRHREEVPSLTMNTFVRTVKATGRIGVVGVFVPGDPNAQDTLAKRGRIAFDAAQFRIKGQSMGTGQADSEAGDRQLSRLIEPDKVRPSWVVLHELPLERAPEAYETFDKREKGWAKVVLKSGKSRWSRWWRPGPAAVQGSLPC